MGEPLITLILLIVASHWKLTVLWLLGFEPKGGKEAKVGVDGWWALMESSAGRADPSYRLWRMRWAAMAAPKPLSMLVTVRPEAQELSMPSRAARPWKEAP